MIDEYSEVHLKIESIEDKEKIIHSSRYEFGSIGCLEFNLSEKQVDSILGDDAFCGGDLPPSLMEKLENSSESDMSLIFYFYGDSHHARAKDFASDFPTASVKSLPVEDWNKTWREMYKRIRVTDDFYIIPSWEKAGSKEVKGIYLYPGQGFGTGNHETTILCLKEFLGEDFTLEEGERILDLGCGSGILGVSALTRFPRNPASFVDIDTDSLKNTAQNIALNFTGNEDFSGCEVVLRERYQVKENKIVFANILLPVLKQEKSLVIDSLSKGGKVIFSGVLQDQVQDLVDAYSDQLTFLRDKSLREWSSVVMVKK